MKADEINLRIMSNARMYHAWIYDNIKRYLGNDVLEIGAGVGNMTEFLLDGREVLATDISDTNLSALKERFKDNNRLKVSNADISRGIASLNSRSFNTIVCINVLEHIEDDIGCLENLRSLLSPEGKLVLVLPAFKFAYGTIDKADEHYRRYDKGILAQLSRIGFRTVKARYMNLPGLFGWIWHGIILKLDIHHASDLDLFDKLVPVFSAVEKLFPFLPGLSLIVVCEKAPDIKADKD